MLKEHKNLDVINAIIEHESGQLDETETIALFAELLKTGMVWQLQGCYGRLARDYIEAGILDREGNIL